MQIAADTRELARMAEDKEQLRVGLIGQSVAVVTSELTARTMGSGSLEVLATPALVAQMESAAVSAIETYLSSEEASVGIEIHVQHLAATPIGEQIISMAEVIKIEDRLVTFAVRAWDEKEMIGEGTHLRYIIDIERFLERLRR